MSSASQWSWIGYSRIYDVHKKCITFPRKRERSLRAHKKSSMVVSLQRLCCLALLFFAPLTACSCVAPRWCSGGHGDCHKASESPGSCVIECGMATVDVAYDVKVYVEPSRVVPLRDEQRLFVVVDLTRQRGSKQVR